MSQGCLTCALPPVPTMHVPSCTPDTLTGAPSMHLFTVRRARLRPGFARLYPELAPDVWMSASRAARLVRSANRRHRRELVPGARVLSELHFEFKGGRRSRQELTGCWTPRAEARAG